MKDNQINDGGTAFPVPDNVSWDHTNSTATAGMSLRDYFAGQALAGGGFDPNWNWDTVALSCYLAADAMIAARERVKE